MTSVAVIGLGAMGAPIARRLHAAGFDLTACDRREDGLREFTDLGAKVTNRPADCVEAEVALVLVATYEQVHAVLFGEHGLVSELEGRTPPVVVVMSTVGPDRIGQLAEILEPLAVDVVDAPFSGGKLRASNGTLSIMGAGDRRAFDIVEPVLAAISSEIFYCGPIGTAQTVKLVNNIVGVVNAFVSAEAYRIALEKGLSLADTAAVMEASSGRNALSASPGLPARSYASWTETRSGYESMRSIMIKDLDIVRELAGHLDGDYPLLEQLSSLLKSLGEETFATWRRIAEAEA
jgi:3-hydroxyisobutyrate dehydrogenase